MKDIIALFLVVAMIGCSTKQQESPRKSTRAENVIILEKPFAIKGLDRERTVRLYLPEDYELKEEVTVFASGKDGIFTPGTPIGVTSNNSGKYKNEIKLFVDPNQLSFVTVNLKRLNKEKF